MEMIVLNFRLVPDWRGVCRRKIKNKRSGRFYDSSLPPSWPCHELQINSSAYDNLAPQFPTNNQIFQVPCCFPLQLLQASQMLIAQYWGQYALCHNCSHSPAKTNIK